MDAKEKVTKTEREMATKEKNKKAVLTKQK